METATVSQDVGASTVRWRSIALYVALAFALSWAIWNGLRAAGVPFTLYAALGNCRPGARRAHWAGDNHRPAGRWR